MIKKYKWKKRLLISYFNDDEFHSFIKKQVNYYFQQNNQEIEERRLKYVVITQDDFHLNQIQIFKKDTFGLYLIGLDGTVKGYSKDLKLLDSLLDIIDSMPMRKMDMKK